MCVWGGGGGGKKGGRRGGERGEEGRRRCDVIHTNTCLSTK